MQPLRRIATIVLILLACTGCDQATKTLAHEHAPRHTALSLANDTIRLQYVENRGAFLGLGAALPEPARKLLLIGGVAILLVGLLGYAALRATVATTVIGLALIAGGGIGNLIDRIAHDGRVIDFLNLGIGALRTGIFNMADVAILIGTALIAVQLKTTRPAPTKPHG